MPSTPLAGDPGGGVPAQLRVRPDRVAAMLSGGQYRPSVGQRGEQRLVEAFVMQLAVEGFREYVLRRLARRDVIPFDVPFL